LRRSRFEKVKQGKLSVAKAKKEIKADQDKRDLAEAQKQISADKRRKIAKKRQLAAGEHGKEGGRGNTKACGKSPIRVSPSRDRHWTGHPYIDTGCPSYPSAGHVQCVS